MSDDPEAASDKEHIDDSSAQIAEPSKQEPVWIAWHELPLHWREPAAVAAVVVLSDLTIYRGHGYAGFAAMLLALPLIMLMGAFSPRRGSATGISIALMIVVALRLVWLGNWLTAAIGIALLPMIVLAIQGRSPFIPEAAVYASQLFAAGYRRIACYFDRLRQTSPRIHPTLPLEFLLPAGALLVFSVIFILANPSLIDFVSTAAHSLSLQWHRWMSQFSVLELLFWIATAWIGFGLIRPKLDRFLTQSDASMLESREQPSPLMKAYRNTLLTVVTLFAVYLAFEFTTLWFRDFPTGFYYAGYAHQGAAWLTIALALATLLLSFVFRGSILRDPRRASLRKIAWIWSAQNFILAAAVYNRMLIYIDFNGMTRMRTIGLLGISAVVAGFVLVLIKIGRCKSFLWLIRHQLWALGAAVLIYSVIPVDWLAHRYNTRQILHGQLSPSVQICVHPIDSEGYLAIMPLLQCEDPIIRDGVAAMLAEELIRQRDIQLRFKRDGWTRYQMADDQLFNTLQRQQTAFAQPLSSESDRRKAIDAFNDYTYQWY